MKRKLYLVLAVCLSLTAATVMTGCSSSSTNSTNETTTTTQDQSASGETKKIDLPEGAMMGTVEGVNTSTNQILIKTIGGGFAKYDKDNLPEDFDPENAPEGFDKDKLLENFEPENIPEGTDGEKTAPPEGTDGERPELPEGTDGEKPELPEGADGEIPELPEGLDGSQPDISQLEGESITYNITDSTKITDINGNEIALSDIKADDFVIFVAEDTNLISIQVSDVSNMPSRDKASNASES